jgi:hypothetical protein
MYEMNFSVNVFLNCKTWLATNGIGHQGLVDV